MTAKTSASVTPDSEIMQHVERWLTNPRFRTTLLQVIDRLQLPPPQDLTDPKTIYQVLLHVAAHDIDEELTRAEYGEYEQWLRDEEHVYDEVAELAERSARRRAEPAAA